MAIKSLFMQSLILEMDSYSLEQRIQNINWFCRRMRRKHVILYRSMLQTLIRISQCGGTRCQNQRAHRKFCFG